MFHKCTFCRCIYYLEKLINKGPSILQKATLDHWLGKGYMFGNKVMVKGRFYVQRKLQYREYIESQYYNSKTGTKGGRILSRKICVQGRSNLIIGISSPPPSFSSNLVERDGI